MTHTTEHGSDPAYYSHVLNSLDKENNIFAGTLTLLSCLAPLQIWYSGCSWDLALVGVPPQNVAIFGPRNCDYARMDWETKKYLNNDIARKIQGE